MCKSLIGEVTGNSIRKVTLFDTSTEKDLNLNEHLLQKLDPGSGGASRASPVSPALSKSPVPDDSGSSSSNSRSKASPTPNAAANKDTTKEEAPEEEEDEDEALLDLACEKELVPPEVPAVGDYFDVNVTFAASPSNFTVAYLIINYSYLIFVQILFNTIFPISGSALEL